MASRLRLLAPHFLAMFAIYAVVVAGLALAFDTEGFWISLVVAMGIAFGYPAATRRAGVAPEPWRRE